VADRNSTGFDPRLRDVTHGIRARQDFAVADACPRSTLDNAVIVNKNSVSKLRGVCQQSPSAPR
jgi:hypothetical protein